MPQQQIPWWMQYYQGQGAQQAPPPTADSNFRTRLGPEAGGGTFGSIGATAPQQTSPRAQGPPAQPFDPQNPEFEPTPLPQNAPGYPLQYNPSDYSTQVGQGLMLPPQATGGAETLGAFYNPPITETGGGATPVDRYQYPNPAPNETMVQPQVDQYLYNPPPDEEMTAPATQSYYGGGFNPVPNEGMIPNEAPTWMQPNFTNPAPDEAMTANPISSGITNPTPNEDMIANPIAAEPTQSGLSLSGSPDLSIGSNLPNQGYNYYPDGSGGYVVYDQNWNVVQNMPGTGGNAATPSTEPQTPSTVATGADTIIRTDRGTAGQNAPATSPAADQSWTQNPPGAGPLGPEDTGLGGWGQPIGYFPWAGQNPQGSAGIGGQGGTLAGGDNIGAGPLPGSFAGLGSFGPGSTAGVDPGVYGFGGSPGLLSFVRSLGYQNIGQWVVANSTGSPTAQSQAQTGGGGGQTPAATGGVQ